MRSIDTKPLPEKKEDGQLDFYDLQIDWTSEVREGHSIDIVRFHGGISEKNSFDLNQKFYKILDESSSDNMILDLSELSYINSMGLAILHAIVKKYRDMGGTVVVGGIHPFISRILSLTEIIPDFKIFDSCEQAKNCLPWQYHL